jgi:hypothetical protein
MADVHLIDWIKEAFTKRQVINGIHQVGFAGPIVPDKTVQIGRKLNINFFQILKISKGQTFKIHELILYEDKANKKVISRE